MSGRKGAIGPFRLAVRSRRARAPTRRVASARALFGKLKTLFGSTAALGAFMFAVGYLINIAHAKMLGVRSLVDVSTEQVVYDGAMFWPVTVTAWLGAALAWPHGCAVLATASWALLAVFFFAPRWAWRMRRARRGAGAWLCRRVLDPVWRRRDSRWGYLPVLCLTVLLGVSLGLSQAAMSQQDLLVRRAPAQESTGTFRWLTGCSAGLAEALAEATPARALYGALSLLAALCAAAWVWLFWRRIPNWAPTAGAPAVGGFAQFLFLVSGVLLAIQLLLVVFLYGFLVASNDYPAIRLSSPLVNARAAAAQAATWPDEAAPRYHGKLLLIGRKGGTALLFAAGVRQLWWVNESALSQAVQSEPCNVFRYIAPPTAREGRR